jgi:PAS domain S-box-containing protein
MATNVNNQSNHSTERLVDIFNTAPFAIFEIDYNGPRFKSVNQATCELTGYTEKELLTMNPADLLDEKSSKRLRDRIKQGLAGQRIDESVEYKLKSKDGHDIFALLRVKPNYKDGKLDSALIVGFDITQRIKNEDRLKEAEKQKNDILESITDGCVAIDNQWHYSYLNENGAKALRKTRQELIGKNIWEVWKDAPAKFREQLEYSSKMNVPTHFEVFYPQYHNLWYECHCYPSQEGLTIFFSDITERKNAQKSIEKQAALINLSPDAILVRLSDDSIIFWNKGAEKLYGYTEQEALGKLAHKLLRTISPIPISEIEAELKKTGKWTGELQHQTKTGQEVTVQSNWIVEKVISSQQTSILESNIDITQLKKTIHALRASEDKYKTLFNSIDEGFFLIDVIFDNSNQPVDLFYIEANPKATKLVGQDFTGKRLSEIANYEKYWFDIFGNVAITGKSVRLERYAEPNKKWYSFYVFKIGEVESRRIGTIFQDITEAKQAQAKLEEYAKNLEKLVEERTKQLGDSERLATIGTTAGMVGHDIRNPLQAITGDVYLAKSDLTLVPNCESKTSIQESLTAIEKNVDYINKIVQDLQDFAKPLNPCLRKTDIKLIIDKLLEKNPLPENVKVSINVEAEAREILVDSDYATRILYNLLINAVQAMPNGGNLTIRAYKENDDKIVSIKDTGVGIAEDAKDKLFTPMFTTKSKGQGFGLAVIKRMTEALGGTVCFESQEGKGTTFIVRFPPKDKQ